MLFFVHCGGVFSLKKGIYLWGKGKPINKEVFQSIKKAGFDSVMLDWSNDFPLQINKSMAAECAKLCNLEIINGHLSFFGVNYIWKDCISGEEKTNEIIKDILLASKYEIPVLVLHPTEGNNPPPLSNIGFYRLKKIIDIATRVGTRIAFENVEKPSYLQIILNELSDQAGFCYDSGHNNCFSRNIDLLSEFSNRLCAIHLNDNYGMADDHLCPFLGSINWKTEVNKLKRVGYQGAITLEVEWDTSNSLTSFLEICFDSANKIEYLFENE